MRSVNLFFFGSGMFLKNLIDLIWVSLSGRDPVSWVSMGVVLLVVAILVFTCYMVTLVNKQMFSVVFNSSMLVLLELLTIAAILLTIGLDSGSPTNLIWLIVATMIIGFGTSRRAAN